MSEHVLVVGSGRDLPTRVRRAFPDVQTSVICRLEYISKLRELTEHTRVIAVRHDAPDAEWVALAEAAHKLQPFTRIATFGERDQDRCAVIGQALGVDTHSPATVALVHDKQAMRVRLREAGVDSTVSATVADTAALRAFVSEHGLPCIVKPVSGAGSFGVCVVRDTSTLEHAFERAGGSFQGIPDAGVLVERFHEGPQFSVEAFSEGGEHQVVAVTRKFSDPTTFVELGHVSPAVLTEHQEAAIDTCVTRLLDALGVRFGATHTEIVWCGADPRVIETHVRMGGDEVPALALDTTGVDLAESVVLQTLGREVLPGVRQALAARSGKRSSAIWFAAAPTAGVLSRVTGLEAARNTEGVTEVELLAKLDGTIGPLQSSEDRVAYARAVGDTPEEAVAAAKKAVSCLEFHVRAGVTESVTV